MINKYKLQQADIEAIETELNAGNDVRLQTTAYGYRIVSDRVTVLKKVSHDGMPITENVRQHGNHVK